MHMILCYGGMAGAFGGQSVLLAKSTVELLKNLITGTETGAFENFQPYVIIGSMAVCLFAQITTLNAGLERFNALIMVPVYQSFWIMFSVLGGMIYFEEYRDLNPTQTGLFVLGMVITYSGVIYLLRERTKDDEEEGSYCSVAGGDGEEGEGGEDCFGRGGGGCGGGGGGGGQAGEGTDNRGDSGSCSPGTTAPWLTQSRKTTTPPAEIELGGTAGRVG